jgi:hypothetical protein
MPKTKYVVRVVAHRKIELKYDIGMFGHGSWLQCFARAGVIRMHEETEDYICFDILPPAGVGETQVWARHTAGFMQSMSFNAVVAPAMP